MKKFKILAALLLFWLFFASKAYAVTISITDIPSTITDAPFVLTASISGASAGTNYLRVEIFKDGTNNYFGETYNGSDWYSGGDGTLY